MANLSLLDVAVISGGSEGLPGLIEDTMQASPEIRNGTFRTIEGTSFDTLIRKTLPTVGFRNANEGATPVKAAYETKRANTYIVDAPVEMDKAVADAHEDGPEAVLALESEAVLEAAFRALSSQFYYGTATTIATSTAGTPTKGFPGLIEVVDSALEVDAAGTTANARSSIWAVKWGPRYVQWLLGRNGEITSSDPTIVRLTDSNSDPYDGYRIPFLAYIGLKVHNKNGIGRGKNIASDSTATDQMVFDLLEKFPTGVVPDVLYMSRRTLGQIRSSRTATNPTGQPAPIPDSIASVPIIVTDGIVDTEAA